MENINFEVKSDVQPATQVEGDKKVVKGAVKHKKKLIVIGVGLLVAVLAYNGLASFVINREKQKFQDKVMKSLEDRQKKFNTPTVAIDGTNRGENRLVNAQDTNGMIQVPEIAAHDKNADLLLTAAIRAGDLDRMKVLIESGVNTSFTNNKLCIGKGARDNAVFEVPANTDQLEHAIAMHPGSGQYLLMTECSKLFLIHATEGMHKMNEGREFFTMNNFGFSDSQIALPDSNNYKQNYLRMKADDAEKTKTDQRKEDVFNFLMDKTNFYVNGNAEQLPFVYRNTELPYSVRQRALKAFVEVKSNPSKIISSPNIQAFDLLSRQLVESVNKSAKAGSYNQSISNDVKNVQENNAKFSSILDDDFKNFISEFAKAGGNYVDVTKDLSGNPYYLQNGHVSYQSELELSLTAFKEKGISYKKDKSSMLYWTNVAGRGFYAVDEVNSTIGLINTVLDSGMVNLKRQYGDGSTVLHYIAEVATGESEGQALASLNRYLLNKGANPNLLNNKGETALEIMMKNGNGGSSSRFTKLIESYTSANFVK